MRIDLVTRPRLDPQDSGAAMEPLVPCPVCLRTFSQTAISRHAAVCQKVQSKPKRAVFKVSVGSNDGGSEAGSINNTPILSRLVDQVTNKTSTLLWFRIVQKLCSLNIPSKGEVPREDRSEVANNHRIKVIRQLFHQMAFKNVHIVKGNSGSRYGATCIEFFYLFTFNMFTIHL